VPRFAQRRLTTSSTSRTRRRTVGSHVRPKSMAHSFPLSLIIKNWNRGGSDGQRTRPSTVSIWKLTRRLFPRGRSTKRAESVLRLSVTRVARPWGYLGADKQSAKESWPKQPPATGPRGGVRGHFDVGELLGGFDIVFVVVSSGRFAFGECRNLERSP